MVVNFGVIDQNVRADVPIREFIDHAYPSISRTGYQAMPL
jgi:hypothetical protein